MIFSLDVRRARKGDCMLLHFGTKKSPGLVLIDGGPEGVYAQHLKPRIAELRKKRKLQENEELFIDMLMVSHVDDDHMQGILDMTRELRDAKDAKRPRPVQFGEIWHNSFDEIIDNASDKITSAMANTAMAGLKGELPQDIEFETSEDEETTLATLKVLASIPQGFRLREDARKLDIPLNQAFATRLVMADAESQPLEVGPGLTFTVIGPMAAELEALRKKHNEWLEALQKKKKSPSAALAAYVDKSVANLSSIVVLAQSGDKSMLLTGDARGDKILEGLELAGVIRKGEQLRVNLLKVPHHGSARNLTTDFFKRVVADHYVFSGNGEHGNPEREALEMLLKARGNGSYTIHLTYEVDEIDAARKKDWEKEQNAAKKKNKNKKVRPNWSAEEHSLAALLAANSTLKGKLEIVDDSKPHIINLGDAF